MNDKDKIKELEKQLKESQEDCNTLSSDMNNIVHELHREIKRLKSNSYKAVSSNFTIKINDTYCEYEYPLRISKNYSIDQIAKRIFKSFRTKEYEGRLVKY